MELLLLITLGAAAASFIDFGGSDDDAEIFTGIAGTDDADSLDGTHDAEEIRGYAGNDFIFAHGGDDTVLGGEGDDLIIAAGGHDFVHGGDGDDFMGGDDGNDILSGGQGADGLNGGAGFDVLYANEHGTGSSEWFDGAYDQLFGLGDNDTLFFSGGDFADGGAGADSFHVGDLTDVVPGQPAVIQNYQIGVDRPVVLHDVPDGAEIAVIYSGPHALITMDGEAIVRMHWSGTDFDLSHVEIHDPDDEV